MRGGWWWPVLTGLVPGPVTLSVPEGCGPVPCRAVQPISHQAPCTVYAGLHYAAEQAWPGAELVQAFDINDTANDVYEHNFGHRPCQVRWFLGVLLDSGRAQPTAPGGLGPCASSPCAGGWDLGTGGSPLA